MVFIPKWFPYALIAAGIYSLFDGDVGIGIIFLIVGGVWLFIRRKFR